MNISAARAIENKIGQFPRKKILCLPTPFYKLEKLSADLGGPTIYVKRDDLTGQAFGGNKSRKLEFILGDALNQGADVIVTWGSLQSNWCLQTAAAARRFGLKPVLILYKSYALPPGYDGNMLLEYILGADIRIREAPCGKVVNADFALAAAEEIAEQERKKGHHPYIVAVGGSQVLGDMTLPLGAVGYVQAYLEMRNQAAAEDVHIDYILHATGSGGTQAGLTVAAKALAEGCRVLGIAVSDEKEAFARCVVDISTAAVKALGLPLEVGLKDVHVWDEYVQDGYGIVNQTVAEVIRRVFTAEGIVLDPVYTAKAAAGLIDLAAKGYFRREDNVVFLHTGGTPALFPNREKIVDCLMK